MTEPATTKSATTEPATAEPATTQPATGGGVTPYLAVVDARRALTWYAEVFGARPRGEPIVMPDDRIGHAEIELSGGRVMLADERPEIGVVAPRPGQGAAVTLHAEVRDVDAVVDRAVAAGATPERPPRDEPYRRVAVVRDPFGHRWLLNAPPSAAGSGPG